MRHVVLGFIVVLALAGCAQEPAGEASPDEALDGSEMPGGERAPPGGMDSAPDVTFTVTGENYAFFMDGEENPTLRVSEGDRVRIEFESAEGFHDWVLDEFGAATEQVSAGGTTSVEFVADEAGEYAYYCSVGRHRELGMEGAFIVE